MKKKKKYKGSILDNPWAFGKYSDAIFVKANARKFPCPACGAVKGAHCINKAGKHAESHARRIQLFKDSL